MHGLSESLSSHWRWQETRRNILLVCSNLGYQSFIRGGKHQFIQVGWNLWESPIKLSHQLFQRQPPKSFRATTLAGSNYLFGGNNVCCKFTLWPESPVMQMIFIGGNPLCWNDIFGWEPPRLLQMIFFLVGITFVANYLYWWELFVLEMCCSCKLCSV